MGKARALTIADDDRGILSREVVGELKQYAVPSLSYTRSTVDGIDVDPATVQTLNFSPETESWYVSNGAGVQEFLRLGGCSWKDRLTPSS